MKSVGFACTGLLLATMPALAQPVPLDQVAPGAPEQQAAAPTLSPQQLASAPAAAAFDNMLTAVRNSGQVAQEVDSMGLLPERKIETRDATALSRQGEPGELDLAVDGNRQGVEDLRRALIRNKSIDRALARDQVPITSVVAADIRPGGRVVVYVRQGLVPPR